MREQTATDSRLRTLHVTTTGRSHINAESASRTLSELNALFLHVSGIEEGMACSKPFGKETVNNTHVPRRSYRP